MIPTTKKDRDERIAFMKKKKQAKAKKVIKITALRQEFESLKALIRGGRSLISRYRRQKAEAEVELRRLKERTDERWLEHQKVADKIYETGRKCTESQLKLTALEADISSRKNQLKKLDLKLLCPEIDTVSSLFRNLREHIEILNGTGRKIDGIVISSESFYKLMGDDAIWTPMSNYDGVPIRLSSGLKEENGIILHVPKNGEVQFPTYFRNDRNVVEFPVG